jgi:hypothetical protein
MPALSEIPWRASFNCTLSMGFYTCMASMTKPKTMPAKWRRRSNAFCDSTEINCDKFAQSLK